MMRAKELMGGKCKMWERGKVGFCVRKVKQQQCSVYKLVSVKNLHSNTHVLMCTITLSSA